MQKAVRGDLEDRAEVLLREPSRAGDAAGVAPVRLPGLREGRELVLAAEVRGRALGGWNFAIGWGWIGPLTLGAVAEATSVPLALTLNGTLLVVVAVAALAASRTLRERRR